MTAATTNEPAPNGPTASRESPAGPDVYASGTLRKIAFSFIFLLLLPFFVSLGPMLFARISQGYWIGTPGLILLSIAFATVMGLIVVELVSSIRSRVVLGEKAVRIRLPQARGLMGLFSYKSFDVPYSDIAAVEIRREIYGGSLAPVIMKGARLVLKDGSNVKLGYVNERNVDPAFPFAEIGERIAARADVQIIDVGNVHRSAFKKTFGLEASPEQKDVLTDAEIAAINHRHGQVIFLLVGILILLVSLGVFSDINSDIGHANLLSTHFGSSSGADR